MFLIAAYCMGNDTVMYPATVKWLAILFCVSDIPVTNLMQEASCSEGVVIFSVSPDKCLEGLCHFKEQ
jgi:hypothetical protein